MNTHQAVVVSIEQDDDRIVLALDEAATMTVFAEHIVFVKSKQSGRWLLTVYTIAGRLDLTMADAEMVAEFWNCVRDAQDTRRSHDTSVYTQPGEALTVHSFSADDNEGDDEE